MAVQAQSVPVTVEFIRAAVAELQLSVYFAAMVATAGAAVAFALHRLPDAPPGKVPANAGACVSPPVKTTTALAAELLLGSLME